MKKYKIFSIILIISAIILLCLVAFKAKSQDYKQSIVRDTIPAVLVICDTTSLKTYDDSFKKQEFIYNENNELFMIIESRTPLNIAYWVNGYIVISKVGIVIKAPTYENSSYIYLGGPPETTIIYLDENKNRLNKFVIVYKTK